MHVSSSAIFSVFNHLTSAACLYSCKLLIHVNTCTHIIMWNLINVVVYMYTYTVYCVLNLQVELFQSAESPRHTHVNSSYPYGD